MSDKELKEILKYYSSERLKNLQRKFTTASTLIKNEALGYPLSGLLTKKDREILEKATVILTGYKRSIEQLKEAEARKEKREEQIRKKCWSQRSKLFEKYMPTEVVSLLLLRLALKTYKRHITESRFYNLPDNDHIFVVVERALDPSHHFKLDAIANNCFCEMQRWIVDESALWPHDETPDESVIKDVMDKFNNQWREQTRQTNSAIIEAIEQHIAIKNSDNVTQLKARK